MESWQGISVVQNGHHGIRLLTADANFEPIRLNAKASGGERVLNSFDDIVAFILMRVKFAFASCRGGKRSREDFPRQKETQRRCAVPCSKRDGWPSDARKRLTLAEDGTS
jgi:hypothetical protein